MLVFWIPTHCLALNKDRTLAQYVHSSWGAAKGYGSGTVYAIAQSRDGYLWLGTEHGLVRFNGSEFTPIELPVADHRPAGAVRGLVEDTDGNLWIRLNGPRLMRYRDGTFEDSASRFELHEAFFTAMSRSDAGSMLLWGPQNSVLSFRANQFQRIRSGGRIPGIVISLIEPSPGVLWLGSRDAGLYKIENGVLTKVLPDVPLRSVNALAASEHGGVWIGSETGLHLWERGALVPLKLPDQLRKAQVFTLVRDRHHNLWVGTDVGLYRIDPEREAVTGVLRDANDPEVTSIYEDADGSIWFAGSHGLERLRDGMFTSFSSPAAPLKQFGGPLFVDDSGRAWFGPASGGLFCLENGAFHRIPIPGNNNDVIYSIHGTKDELWLGRQAGGLTELVRNDNHWLPHVYMKADGLAQNSVYTVTRARDGTVWAGTVSGGLSVLRHGQFTNYTASNGLPSNAIFSSMEGSDGTMWFASPSGLISFDGQHWTTSTPAEAELPSYVRTVFESAKHTLWLGTSRGIARFDHGQIVKLRGLPQVLCEEVLSIGQDSLGFLWLFTSEHVLQVDETKLLEGTIKESDVLIYGSDDGLMETKGVRRDRSLFADSSGRIWVSLLHSLAVADVTEADGYRREVGVRIEPISPESGSPLSGDDLDLSPNTRSLAFRYAGTNMASSYRTQFRYRLDALDQSWTDDALSRQVVYTHLTPGTYTFRIMASNALGVWNGPENAIRFTIRPALWQTWYFKTLAAFVVAAIGIALYRIRLAQIRTRLRRRFEDRLAERTRIAQELHDTLLQGVLSVSMQLDVAQDHLSDSSPAKPLLLRSLELVRQVTEEGREALRGLRTIDASVSLETALKRASREIRQGESHENPVHVQGTSRTLKPVVFDEAYRIGREAYLNAVTHSAAASIEILIEYGIRSFRLRVRDDGCGIDPPTLKHGRDGHWGLAGMRERAAAISSALTIHTRTPGGTDVELRVPAAIAYSHARSGRIGWLWPFRGRYADSDETRSDSL